MHLQLTDIAHVHFCAFSNCQPLMEAKMFILQAHQTGCAIAAVLIGNLVATTSPVHANVITDWDAKAVAIVTPMPPYDAQRVLGMVHAAMFDAVNSIEQRYRPYLVRLPAASDAWTDAAAAAAATTV